MFDNITNWFANIKREMSGLTQKQREAKLDLLILMMYADRHIDENESQEIIKESKSFVWENREYHVQLYIDKTIAKVRSVIYDDDKLSSFIEDILTRLEEKDAIDKALISVEKFMDIDFDISDREKELLATIKDIFSR
jgi:hypothetical protein